VEASQPSMLGRPIYTRPALQPLAIPAPLTGSSGAVSAWWADVDRARVRRALNVIVACVGIIVALPLLAVIAVAIKLTSPGPVIFKQTRVGLDRRTPGVPPGNWRRGEDHGGRLFTMYKFRTMRADSGQAQVWAAPNDPRVTRIGAVLRKYRLDELPQLFNVLKGDMNVVGPRPEQPAIFADLRGRVGGYPVRQRVLPGITGWAQVNQAYDATIEDVERKVELDLEYIRRQSAVEDLRILARTVPTVILGKGAW
jgi:lipopolysaccharide/colanic/teichoic acid biosynthesis glycosyltransferase